LRRCSRKWSERRDGRLRRLEETLSGDRGPTPEETQAAWGRAADRARACLGRRAEKEWEGIAPLLLRHYITKRGVFYNRRKIDDWHMERRSPFDA
jgi:hypothetical protein